jgi:hypothetical protein
MFEQQEHPFMWLSRKQHKTHFGRPGKSSPANNSELLYDGSAEARAILASAHEGLLETYTGGQEYFAFTALENALDYLKGKDVRGRFSGTKELFDSESTLEALLTPEPEEKLVQIDMSSIESRIIDELGTEVTNEPETTA